MKFLNIVKNRTLEVKNLNKKFSISIRHKIILSFVVAGTIVIALLGGILYKIVEDYENVRINEKIKSTAQFSARYLDAEAHKSIKEGDENTSTYKKLVQYLRGIQKDTGVTYIYTFERFTSDKVKFVLDSDDTEDRALIGEEFDNNEEIKNTFNGNVTLISEPATDEWGTFLTGFAPIKDSTGKVVAVLGVDISILDILQLKETLKLTIFFCMLIGIIILILVSFFISKMISKPVISLKKTMEEAERGNLSVRAAVFSRDELGQLTQSFNNLMKETSRTIGVIHNTMVSLKKSSLDMTGVANTLVTCSEDTSDKANKGSIWVSDLADGFNKIDISLADAEKLVYSVATSVEAMNITVNEIAKSAEITASEVKNTSEQVDGITLNISKTTESTKNVSMSVNNVVTAVKEINISLSEVSTNCNRSMSITNNAKIKTSETSTIIEKLNSSSKNISNILYLINSVAEQTNMLALNAAIEAAGAGEAGKGFAVVANEVKELAKKTRDATDEINDQIEEMNMQMGMAVKAVSSISTVVEEVNTINNTIASAVTQQAAITNDISHSAVNVAEKVAKISHEIESVYEKAKFVLKSSEQSSNSVKYIADSTEKLSSTTKTITNIMDEASTNLKHIVKMSGELSKGSTNIRSTMHDISASSEEVTASAEETSHSAQNLDLEANELNRLVSKFKF